MAADYEKTLRRRKRKRIDQNIPKLLPDERVEVRSLDEGCLGSWHTATVTRCDDLVREVRYDHLLFDDGSSNLIEWVDVSPIIDGVDALDVVTDNYRGLIRPLPPSLDLGRWSLHYGQCVDMHLEDAWWEGVIFDHEAGSEERNIFFPDMGDEAKAHIEKLRITQVWDEMTEKWKPRGNWLFLELIEEVEQEWPLPVSVKQIWYEVRVKKGYENLKEWTSSARETWRKLVLQVLCDNFKLTVKQIIHEFNSSGNLVKGGQPLVELPEPAFDAMLMHEEVFGNSLSIIPSEFSDWLNSHEVTSSSMPGHQETLSSLPILTILPFNPDTFSNITCNENSNGSSTKMRNGKLKLLTQRPRLEWLPAGPDMVPEPEFCPHAIIKYCEVSCKRSGVKNLILKARAHLSYLGWKIEFARDGRIIRMRYTSPGRKYYLSLLQVCRELEAELGFQSPLPQDDEGRLFLYPQDDQRGLSPITQDSHRKSSSHDGFISSSLQKPKRRKKKSKLHSCPRVAIPPKYCPQAVEDYINDLRKDTALKAKKHLAAVGWSFSIHCKGIELGKRIKNKMRYRSPGGKLFYTLISACEWYNNEAELSFHDTDTFRERQHMNVPKESKGLLALNGSCSPSTDLKFQESSMLQVDLSDRILSEPSSWMLLSKDPVEQGKANSFGIRKLQKKRKNGLANLPLQTYYQNEDSLLLNEQEPGPLVKVADDVNANSSTRVLRSCKRARQGVTPSSHQTPRTVLSWLIDNNVVLPTAKVQYRGRKDAHTMAEGRITRDGIKCCCCQNVFTLTNFEAHAGSTNHRPSANIFLEDGRSLFECQLQLRREKKFRSPKTQPRERKGNRHYSRNDDICSVCHYGGELVLCDQCPSSFHTSCLGLKEVPDGDWFCPSCCCGICGQSRFDKNTQQLTDNRVCSCSQCEHQYHFGCLRDKGLVQSGSYPDGDWFCNTKCEQIFQSLRQLLGKPIPVGIDNLTWTLLKYIKSEDGVHDELYDESSMENYSKLSVALSVMHECFEPVKEPRTRRDIVEDVVFSRWSELNRLNFQGFYTVLLERNDELITVATVRVYGEKVAEVPLVGTRFRYRRLGMCRILMNELEKKLMEFGVERLVLPAIPSVLNTWTTSFGFSKMEESERLNFLDYTFLYFEGTVMCQKLLKKISSSALSPSTGLQQKSISHTDKTGTMDFDGNSGVSVVYQADRVEESEIVDQGFAEGGGLGSNQKVSSPLPTVPNEPHLVDCLVEDTDDKEGENSSNGLLRCYKRRISAC